MKTERSGSLRVATAAALAALMTSELLGSPALLSGPGQTASPADAEIQIEHDPLPCLTTSTAPRVEASFQPASALASARVYWRVSRGPSAFYFTTMTGTPPRLQALLPRVTSWADSLEYWIEATDAAGKTRRSATYVAPLVAANCIARGIVPLVAGLGLTIGLTDPEQPRLPAGVNPDDIGQVTLASGETVPATQEDRRRAAAGAPSAGAAAPSSGKGGISKGVLIGAGVLAVGGIAAAAGGGGGGGSTGTPGGVVPTATPTPTPPLPPTATPTVGVPFRLISVEATWSGPGDVDIVFTDSSGQPVAGAQTIPAGCESTASRTERVVVQGTSVRAGNYLVRLTGKTCGAGTPTAISTLLTVQTDTQPKCPSSFVIVPVGQTVNGCTFTLP